ncbi:hypothetical protein IGB42_03223 [Andreprevotia sp. IGB-42]|uniref:kelch repeat-containing protein n=1 Tax=Andreprevotia sp. IGB-42 TaxID=2497473 RepID=UPI00135B0FC7|nr:kelch repeat-containing protein [Andreprevotia sp. IGB-42]KAF0812233.1 hypothetical protein IGB42_03223 [Andreprevotia sp. IGB-42]
MNQSRFRPWATPMRIFVAALLTATGAQAAISTGSLGVPRMFHQASNLPDGRVLFTGGEVRPGTPPYTSAEIYDPATSLFSAINPMQQPRAEHAAVTLSDGRVLVVGGSVATSPSLVGTATAEIYDPATGQWAVTGSMNFARTRVLARLLPDGRVFVIDKATGYGTPYAEVYDPQTGTFTKTGNMVVASNWHGIVVLNDGRVLKAGGEGANGYLTQAEIWNPATNQWTATGTMGTARENIQPTLLPDGKVLVAGGRNITFLGTAEIYDPATGTFAATTAMPQVLNQADYSLPLANGDVLVSGAYTRNILRYNVASGSWTTIGPKRLETRAGTANVLANGSLLLAGGAEQNDATSYGEVFEPACTTQAITLNTASISLASDNGSATVTVSGAPGCRLEAAGLPAWLQAATPNPLTIPATGSLVVTFTAASNATGSTRSASFTLGNKSVSASQATSPVCPTLPTLTPGTFSFGAAATSGTLNVAAAASCPWSISGPSWFTLTGAASGTGNATLNYAVAANTGTARSGTLQLSALGNSNAYAVTQSAPAACATAPVLTPTSINLPAAGGSATVSVAASASCNWTATLPGWASFSSASSGTGNGSFTFTTAANSGSTARSGSGAVQGPGVASTFNLYQPVATCSAPPAQPISSGATANGVLQANSCSYGLRGNGYNTDRYTFQAAPGNKIAIMLASTAFDTYLYLQDPTGKQIAFNDDSSGTNSRIPAYSGTFTLPAGAAGAYTIQVSSYYSGSTGAYSLGLSVTP